MKLMKARGEQHADYDQDLSLVELDVERLMKEDRQRRGRLGMLAHDEMGLMWRRGEPLDFEWAQGLANFQDALFRTGDLVEKQARFARQLNEQALTRQRGEQHDLLPPDQQGRGLDQVFEDQQNIPVQQDKQEEQLEQSSKDDDELANTAAELLNKVSHDTSTKFQNSAFLGLMRRLADREVKVEGDKMVEVRRPKQYSGRPAPLIVYKRPGGCRRLSGRMPFNLLPMQRPQHGQAQVPAKPLSTPPCTPRTTTKPSTLPCIQRTTTTTTTTGKKSSIS